MTETWALARDILVAPSKAADRLRDKNGFKSAAWLYLIFIGLNVAFYAWKPFDFPTPDAAELPLQLSGSHGWLFWTQVEVWDMMLTAAGFLFLAWFCGFFRSSWLTALLKKLDSIQLASLPALLASFLISFVVRFIPFLLLVAAVLLLGFIPLVANLLFVRHVIGKPLLVVLWLILLGGTLPAVKSMGGVAVRSLASLVLSLNVIDIALLPFLAIATVQRWETVYEAIEIVAVLWTLILGCHLLSRLAGIRLPRAFAAFFLSMLCQIWFLYAAYLMGLIPKDILKALVSV